MDAFLVSGPCRISGELAVSGAKNAALPAVAAALLSERPVSLDRLPAVADIRTMKKLLSGMGVAVSGEAPGTVTLDASRIVSTEAPYDLVRTMRASILVLGPLLARFGEARVSLPGGCAIGVRPVDLHIMAFEAMGARIAVEKGYIHAHVSRVGPGRGRLTGATVRFPQVTVTGTENVMLAATLARGVTTIENAAREPEVVDLAALLVSMGARISGAGTATIVVEGLDTLPGTAAAARRPRRPDRGGDLRHRRRDHRRRRHAPRRARGRPPRLRRGPPRRRRRRLRPANRAFASRAAARSAPSTSRPPRTPATRPTCRRSGWRS